MIKRCHYLRMSIEARVAWWLLAAITVAAVFYGALHTAEKGYVLGPVLLAVALVPTIYLRASCDKVLGTS